VTYMENSISVGYHQRSRSKVHADVSVVTDRAGNSYVQAIFDHVLAFYIDRKAIPAFEEILSFLHQLPEEKESPTGQLVDVRG